jgi:hypothetical protein
MRQAQTQELHNRRGELNAAIGDLERVKRNAGRGNAQASYDGYLRTWTRIERLARCIYEMTGEESTVPSFDPPLPPHMATKTQRLGKSDPLAPPVLDGLDDPGSWLQRARGAIAAAVAPAKPAQKIPDHIPVGSARWYRIQGQEPPAGCPE